MDHSHHTHDITSALANADPLAFVGFVAIFSFSFMSSLHCAFMCVPLVCSLLGRSGVVSYQGIVLYNLGRFISYVSAGALLGAFGGALLSISAAFGGALALLMAISLFYAAWRSFHGSREIKGAGLMARAAQPLLRWAHRIPSPLTPFALGLITVALPCMTLAPILAVASATGSMLNGAALMAAFQLGTLGVMIFAPLMPNKFTRRLSSGALPKVALIFLLIGGLATLYRLFH